MPIELAALGASADVSRPVDVISAGQDGIAADDGGFGDVLGALTVGETPEDDGTTPPPVNVDECEDVAPETAAPALTLATAAPLLKTSAPPPVPPQPEGLEPVQPAGRDRLAARLAFTTLGAEAPAAEAAGKPGPTLAQTVGESQPLLTDLLADLLPRPPLAASHPQARGEAAAGQSSRFAPHLGRAQGTTETAEARGVASAKASPNAGTYEARRLSAAAEALVESLPIERQPAGSDTAMTQPNSVAGQLAAALADSGVGARHEGRGQEYSRHAQSFVPMSPTLPTGLVTGQAVEPAIPTNVGVPPDAPAPGSVPGQVIRAITLQWRQGVGEARIQLHPEHLGHVTVNLRVEGGTVTALLRAESQTVSDQIQAQQQQLRTALEQLGLALGRLLVTVDPDARRQHRAPWPDEPPRRPRRGALTTTPLFEIEV